MLYMLTATEVIFIKELLEHLAALADPCDYTVNEVDTALELLNRLESIETDSFLDYIQSIEIEEDYQE